MPNLSGFFSQFSYSVCGSSFKEKRIEAVKTYKHPAVLEDIKNVRMDRGEYNTLQHS